MPPDDITTTLKTYVIQEVRSRIIDGRYAPGQRLSENTLAKELDTSRAPVRDALMTLRGEGLVQVYPQRGSYVFNPSHEERLALCEVSAIYEMGALLLATERNSDKLCELLDEQMAYGEQALANNNMLEWAKADRNFHEYLIQLSENPFLIEAYKTIGARIATLVYRLPPSHERMASSVAQHKSILAKICQQDLIGAGEFLRRNNLAVAEILMKN